MNKFIKYPLVLGVVGAICGFGLAAVNGVTSPIIAQRIKDEATASVKELYPSATEVEDVTSKYSFASIDTIYEIKVNGVVSAYGYQAVGTGYGGDITMLFICSTDGNVVAYKTISHSETKGGTYGETLLGSADFAAQFSGLSLADADAGNIDFAGGSTAKVTMKGVKAALKNVVAAHGSITGNKVEQKNPDAEGVSEKIQTAIDTMYIADSVENITGKQTGLDSAIKSVYAINKDGNAAAYAYQVAEEGFEGEIRMLILCSATNDKIIGFRTLSHSEDDEIPYGGVMLNSADFNTQFDNLDFANAGDIDYVAGSTASYTMDAVKKAVNAVIAAHKTVKGA